MSVFAAMRDALRAVAKVSATGFKVLGSALYRVGHFVGIGMQIAYRGCSNGFRSLGRSYARGVKYSYYTCQGHLVTGPDSVTLPRMTPIEKGLHFSISLAGFWGILGAFVVHSAGTLRDTVKIMMATLYVSARRRELQPSYHDDNVARPQPSGQNPLLNPAERHPFIKYVVGFPGLVLGGIVGAVATTVWANMLAVSYMVASMTRYATGRFDAFEPGYQDRLKLVVRFALGFPGTVLGAVIGAIPATMIGAVRALRYMTWTFFTAFSSTVGLPWNIMTRPTSLGDYISECDRDMLGKAGLSVSYDMGNSQHISARQKYTRFQVYGLGAPGIFLGVLCALPFAAMLTTIGMARFFPHSCHDIFRVMINVIVPKPAEWEIFGKENPMTALQRVLFGLPGFIVGAAAGAVVGTLVVVGRSTINSAKLFRSLAGGAFNMAWGYPVFKTNPKDWQHVNRWGFGIPGIILASPVVVLSAVFFVTKYTVAAVMALVAAPVVAIWRAAREAWKITHGQLAFQGLSTSDEASKVHHVMHRFFSALSIGGHLPVGAALAMPTEHKDLSVPPPAMYAKGFKAVIKFLRKCFTFNAETDDERLLHGIYFELKAAMNGIKSTDLGGAIKGAVTCFLEQAREMDIANRFEAEERKVHANNVGRAIATALGVTYPDTPRPVEGTVVQAEPAVMIAPVQQPACYGDLFFANRGYTSAPVTDNRPSYALPL